MNRWELSTPHVRALEVLVRVYDRDGRATFRDVADEAGMALSYCYAALSDCRDAGLCSWLAGHAGTLRPLVEARSVTRL